MRERHNSPRIASRPLVSLLFLDNGFESSLESSQSDLDNRERHENGGTKHEEKEEDNLLPGVDFGEVDCIKAGQRLHDVLASFKSSFEWLQAHHGADGQE